MRRDAILLFDIIRVIGDCSVSDVLFCVRRDAILLFDIIRDIGDCSVSDVLFCVRKDAIYTPVLKVCHQQCFGGDYHSLHPW